MMKSIQMTFGPYFMRQTQNLIYMVAKELSNYLRNFKGICRNVGKTTGIREQMRKSGSL